MHPQKLSTAAHLSGRPTPDPRSRRGYSGRRRRQTKATKNWNVVLVPDERQIEWFEN
ncbi:hypothetical protein M404DRAFT_994408, partial [Pisolithus tinctorius Marx 270]